MENLKERDSPSFVPRPDTCGDRLFFRLFFRRPLYGLLSALLVFLPGTFPAAFAQPSLRFEHISVEHNLSSDAVYKIIQDRHGFIWIGTEDGLHRFDGYEMVVFRHHPESAGSISHNWVINLYEDSQGRLWATNKEVNVLDPAAGLFSQIREYRQDTATLSIHNNIKAVYEDSRGDFWLGGDHLYHFNPPSGRVSAFSAPSEYPPDKTLDILFIREDRQGRLWAGGSYGLLLVTREARKTRISELPVQEKGTEERGSFRAYHLDAQDNLWIGAEYGFLRLNLNNNRLDTMAAGLFHGASHLWQRDIVEDKYGQIWMGGTTRGLLRLNPETGEITTCLHDPNDPHSIRADVGTSLFFDRQGSLWIGGVNGLDRLPGRYVGFPDKPVGQARFLHHYILPQATVRANQRMIRAFLNDSRGNFWVGTYDGLFLFQRNGQGMELAQHLSHDASQAQSLSWNEVRALLEDRRGDIWVATRNGLNRIDAGNKQIERIYFPEYELNGLSEEVFWSLCEDAAGKIWIGTEKSGLLCMEPATRRTRRFRHNPQEESSLSNDQVVTVFQDRQGRIWAGTYGGGLNLYNPADSSFFRFQPIPTDTNSISGSDVWSIFEDTKGRLWAGTQNGLNRLFIEKKGQAVNCRFEHYSEKDGLVNNTVYSILEDSLGRLWLGTMKGLSCFDPDTKVFLNFSLNDGLPSDVFTPNACYKAPGAGELFFGGVDGYVRFQPEQFQADTFAPPVIVSSLTRYNKNENAGNPIVDYFTAGKTSFRFSYLDNILVFNLSMLNFQKPEKNQYEYILEGLRSNWVSLGTDRKITFTGLEPGKYTLRMRGANHNGVRTKQETRLAILIMPPWWWTNLAKATYLILGIVAVLSIYRYQLSKKLAEQETRQLRELDELKSRFFTNISHEFRTPLTVITGMATQVKTNPEQWLDKGIELIQRNSAQLLSLINQILDLRKLESGTLKVNLVQGNIIPYLHYIADSFVPMAQSKGIRIHFLSTSTELEMDYDPDKMLRILSNLLSNAVKYTPGPGDIYLQVDRRAGSPHDQLNVQVKDTGQGIPPEALPYIFDQFYQAPAPINSSEGRRLPKEGSPKPSPSPLGEAGRGLELGGAGSGVGLALVKELVKLLNGTIEADSTLGAGTTFALNFPITRKAGTQGSFVEPPVQGDSLRANAPVQVAPQVMKPADLQNIHTTASAAEGREKEEERPTLLIVEDNPDIRLYLSACLEKGYQLLMAENGQEGIELAIEHVPGLIVSDVMMPVKDGFELCEIMKNDERTSHIPIVLLTAKADFESRMTGLRKGADAYLPKPFEQEELLVRVEQLLILRKKLQERYRNLAAEGQASAPEIPEMEDVFIQKLRQEVMAHIAEEDFGVVHLQRALGISRTQLHNKIKALTGQSTTEFIRLIRLNKARELLQTTDLNISEVSYEVGIGNPAYFSRIYAEAFGESPRQTRK